MSVVRRQMLMNTYAEETTVISEAPPLLFPGLALTALPRMPSLADLSSASKTHLRHCNFQEPSMLGSPLASP